VGRRCFHRFISFIEKEAARIFSRLEYVESKVSRLFNRSQMILCCRPDEIIDMRFLDIDIDAGNGHLDLLAGY
jgi:hypothetical protein